MGRIVFVIRPKSRVLFFYLSFVSQTFDGRFYYENDKKMDFSQCCIDLLFEERFVKHSYF